jgi:hypothetical protein
MFVAKKEISCTRFGVWYYVTAVSRVTLHMFVQGWAGSC